MAKKPAPPVTLRPPLRPSEPITQAFAVKFFILWMLMDWVFFFTRMIVLWEMQ